MLLNRQLSEKQRVEVAKLEYRQLHTGEIIKVHNHYFGQLIDHIYLSDGFQMYVIENIPSKEYTLLFKGSSGVMNGTPATWSNEWLLTNFPIGWSLIVERGKIPSQLTTASRQLNLILRKYPQANFYLYGHSLGSINIQFALSHGKYNDRIKRADIYEGPNLYWLLNNHERQHLKKIKHKINNYIDIYDPVTIGYVDQKRLVGKLKYLDSQQTQPIAQHMWGGYQFSQLGHIKLLSIDDRFTNRANLERAWIARFHILYRRTIKKKQPINVNVLKKYFIEIFNNQIS